MIRETGASGSFIGRFPSSSGRGYEGEGVVSVFQGGAASLRCQRRQ